MSCFSIKSFRKAPICEVIIRSGNESGRGVIKNLHTNICRVEHNGNIVFKNEAETESIDKEDSESIKITERDVWDFATQAPLEDLQCILEASEINSRILEEGLRCEYGLQVGRSIEKGIISGILSADLRN